MSTSSQTTDLVQILVPRELVMDIYQFVSAHGDSDSHRASDHDLNGNRIPDDWSASLVRRMYAESPKHMRAILDTLAARADETVRADELIAVLSTSRGDQATSSTLGGTLGAFGRRVRNRYRKTSWPIKRHWDSDAHQMNYRMTSAVAQLLSPES